MHNPEEGEGGLECKSHIFEGYKDKFLPTNVTKNNQQQ
jgi:hypothetical protein